MKAIFIVQRVSAVCATAVATFALLGCATDFKITHVFDKNAERVQSRGGGGCAGDSFIASHEIDVGSNGKPQANSNVFIRDFWCADGPVAISLNGSFYVIEPVEKNISSEFFRLTGFHSSYANSEAVLRVELKNPQLLRSVVHAATDCTVHYYKVEVMVHFQGVRKVMMGYTGGGCP